MSWSNESFASLLDGTYIEHDAPDEQLDGDGNLKHLICDWCAAGIPISSNPTIAQYWADEVMNPGVDHSSVTNARSGMIPLGIYCEDCRTRRLLFPCKGVGEVRTISTLGHNGIRSETFVSDLSEPSDGIPWDPVDFFEELSDIGFGEYLRLLYGEGGYVLYGPENFVTLLLSTDTGVDPRKLIQWDGSYNETELAKAKGRYRKFLNKMSQDGAGRDAFRKHGRGKRI